MKKNLKIVRRELLDFYDLYEHGRKNTNAPEGYIDYYEARHFLLEALEAIERKHEDMLEAEYRAQAEHEAGASL